MKAYHFTGEKLRDGLDIPAIGEWLIHEGVIIPCESGLHASKTPFDALSYAPGAILHLVELCGEIQTHGEPVDKIVGRKRKIIASFDSREICRYSARMYALEVAHLWDAPDLVLEYLFTGDDNLRASAWDAARESARESAWASAWASARDAARESARDAALASARDAAWASARDAALASARAAAMESAWESAWESALKRNAKLFNDLIYSEFNSILK